MFDLKSLVTFSQATPGIRTRAVVRIGQEKKRPCNRSLGHKGCSITHCEIRNGLDHHVLVWRFYSYIVLKQIYAYSSKLIDIQF